MSILRDDGGADSWDVMEKVEKTPGQKFRMRGREGCNQIFHGQALRLQIAQCRFLL